MNARFVTVCCSLIATSAAADLPRSVTVGNIVPGDSLRGVYYELSVSEASVVGTLPSGNDLLSVVVTVTNITGDSAFDIVGLAGSTGHGPESTQVFGTNGSLHHEQLAGFPSFRAAFESDWINAGVAVSSVDSHFITDSNLELVIPSEGAITDPSHVFDELGGFANAVAGFGGSLDGIFSFPRADFAESVDTARLVFEDRGIATAIDFSVLPLNAQGVADVLVGNIVLIPEPGAGVLSLLGLTLFFLTFVRWSNAVLPSTIALIGVAFVTVPAHADVISDVLPGGVIVSDNYELSVSPAKVVGKTPSGGHLLSVRMTLKNTSGDDSKDITGIRGGGSSRNNTDLAAIGTNGSLHHEQLVGFPPFRAVFDSDWSVEGLPVSSIDSHFIGTPNAIDSAPREGEIEIPTNTLEQLVGLQGAEAGFGGALTGVFGLEFPGGFGVQRGRIVDIATLVFEDLGVKTAIDFRVAPLNGAGGIGDAFIGNIVLIPEPTSAALAMLAGLVSYLTRSLQAGSFPAPTCASPV